MVPLFGDSNLERVFGYSLEERYPSSDSLEDILSNVDRDVNCSKVHMPSHILTKEEIQVNGRMRERAKNFI